MARQTRIERKKSRPSRSWAVRGQPASQPKKELPHSLRPLFLACTVSQDWLRTSF